ncbi:hypothetical protein, partial [Endozoicomonas sp.]|uniref:hypothetical protein n=1 Tax=Endozoicomonas sp. TaxID=1892382 RepID=UPI00383ADE65
FVFWAYNSWSKNTFFDTDIIDVGYDCSSHPIATNRTLIEECTTYKEFIHANTGNSVCTYISGSGMWCECYSEKLQEVYGDACADKVNQLIKQSNLTVPEKYKSLVSDIGELIFMEGVDHTEYPELYDICDEILSRFGSLGYDSEPYMCAILGGNNEGAFEYANESGFTELTLSDFKKMMIVS